MFILPSSLLNESVLLDVIEHLPAGVFAKDQNDEFRFVIWNKEMEAIFAIPRQQMLGKNDYDFFSTEEADYYRLTDIAVMAGDKVVDIDKEEVSTARGKIIAHTVKVPVTLNDGRRILLGILEDITEREHNRTQLEHYRQHLETLVAERTEALHKLATTDLLTGLSNRAHFFDLLEQRVSHAPPAPFCLIYLDLDRFKLVNDTYGHDFGDEILSQVGRRLQQFASRSPDILNIARIGGDEFAVLLDTAIGSTRTPQVCREISTLFDEKIMINQRAYAIGCSMGMSGFPDDAQTPKQMLQHADMAMYHVKHGHHKQRWECFSERLYVQSSRELEIEQGLRHALLNHELYVEYQPQHAATQPCAIEGLEALVRWRSPSQGLVPPAVFIPVSEMSGMIHQITDFVLETVCADLQYLQGKGIAPPRVSINISAMELDEQTGERIQSALDRYGLSPELLTLEITENAKIRSEQDILEHLRPLRARGLRLSIDDFGTGYSSLSYIAELDVDEIKIDKSFIQSARDNSKHDSIVKAIVGIGQAFGHRIVAEGVETTEQLHALQRYPAITVQGYYFNRPQALETLLPTLANPV